MSKKFGSKYRQGLKGGYFSVEPSFSGAREIYEKLSQVTHADQALVGKALRESLLVAVGEFSEQQEVNLDAISSGEAVCILTGQQPGVLGGELLSLYKAVHAVTLAEILTSSLEVPVVPVFWVQSEDSRVEQINKSGYLKNGEFQQFTASLDGGERSPIAHRNFTDMDKVEELEYIVSEFEYHDQAFELFDFYRNNNPATAFICALNKVVGDSGMLFLDPYWSEIKDLSGEFFVKVLSEHRTVAESIKETSESLDDEEYELGVALREDKCLLTVVGENGRERPELFYDSFRINDELWSEGEFCSWILENPEKVGTTALSRPLLESYLLPTIAYVGGDGEVSYLAQLRRSFECLDLVEPMRVSRFGGVVLNPRLGKWVEEQGKSVCDLLTQGVVSEDQVSKRLDEFSGVAENLEKELIQLLEIFADGKGPLEAAKKKSIAQYKKAIGNFYNKLSANLKEGGSQDAQRINRLYQSCFPSVKEVELGVLSGKVPQERLIGWWYYLALLGEEFIVTLKERISSRPFQTGEWHENVMV